MIFHELVGVDLEKRTAICSVCGPTRISVKGKTKKFQCYSVVRAARKRYRKGSSVYKESEKIRAKKRIKKIRLMGFRVSSNWKYRKHVKDVCEKCGYKAIHPSLIDGHHKDGNRKNNVADNIMSLCAICHRLEHLPIDVKESLGTARIVKEAPAKAITDDAKSNITALLDDVERLTWEVAEWREKNKRLIESTNDERIGMLMSKIRMYEARIKELESRLE